VYITAMSRCDNELYGTCDLAGDGIEIELSKRDDKGNMIDLDIIMETLAHELVHAKQFIIGELTPSLKYFKGKDYKCAPYSKQPWEREAYSKQKMLVETFWL
jgi:hypothetical protein